jgi:hypothetical protein
MTNNFIYRFLTYFLVHAGRKLRSKLLDAAKKNPSIHTVIIPTIKSLRYCFKEADGNEITFMDAVKIKVNHYIGLHTDCKWKNHKISACLLTPSAMIAYQVKLFYFITYI